MKINFHRVLLGFLKTGINHPRKSGIRVHFWVGVVDLSRIWYNNCILRGSLRIVSSWGYRSVN